MEYELKIMLLLDIYGSKTGYLKWTTILISKIHYMRGRHSCVIMASVSHIKGKTRLSHTRTEANEANKSIKQGGAQADTKNS